MSVLGTWRMASAERLVAAGSLTECKAPGDKRVCDGAVTKELKSTTPSVQVMVMVLMIFMIIDLPVQVCDMGQLKVKNLKQVGAGAPQLGGGKSKTIGKGQFSVKLLFTRVVHCLFSTEMNAVVLWQLQSSLVEYREVHKVLLETEN